MERHGRRVAMVRRLAIEARLRARSAGRGCGGFAAADRG